MTSLFGALVLALFEGVVVVFVAMGTDKPLEPNGYCWCRCGETAKGFFAPGHDRRLESRIIKEQWGSIAAFARAHGYGF